MSIGPLKRFKAYFPDLCALSRRESRHGRENWYVYAGRKLFSGPESWVHEFHEKDYAHAYPYTAGRPGDDYRGFVGPEGLLREVRRVDDLEAFPLPLLGVFRELGVIFFSSRA
jgi:hypothetical protein